MVQASCPTCRFQRSERADARLPCIFCDITQLQLGYEALIFKDCTVTTATVVRGADQSGETAAPGLAAVRALQDDYAYKKIRGLLETPSQGPSDVEHVARAVSAAVRRHARHVDMDPFFAHLGALKREFLRSRALLLVRKGEPGGCVWSAVRGSDVGLPMGRRGVMPTVRALSTAWLCRSSPGLGS